MKLQNICQEKSIFIQFYKKNLKGWRFIVKDFQNKKICEVLDAFKKF